MAAPLALAPDGPTHTTTGTRERVDGADDGLDVDVDRARRVQLQDQQRGPTVVRFVDGVEDERRRSAGRGSPRPGRRRCRGRPTGCRRCARHRVEGEERARDHEDASNAMRRRIRCAMRTPVASMDMDLARFCSTSRVVIVAGKGGVGKTTVTADAGHRSGPHGHERADRRGRGQIGARVLLRRAGRSPTRKRSSAPGIRARTLTPDDALLEYLEDHGLRRISKRLVGRARSTWSPPPSRASGHPRARQGEAARAGRRRRPDRPRRARRRPRRHASSSRARGLLDAVRVGPIHTPGGRRGRAAHATRPAARCMLVTLPEETPVNELVETAYALEDRVGVALGPVVVNGCVPPLGPAGGALRDDDGVRADAVAARLTLDDGEAAGARRRGRVPRRPSRDARPSRSTRLAERLAPPAAPAAVPLHRRPRAGRARASWPTRSTVGHRPVSTTWRPR